MVTYKIFPFYRFSSRSTVSASLPILSRLYLFPFYLLTLLFNFLSYLLSLYIQSSLSLQFYFFPCSSFYRFLLSLSLPVLFVSYLPSLSIYLFLFPLCILSFSHSLPFYGVYLSLFVLLCLWFSLVPSSRLTLSHRSTVSVFPFKGIFLSSCSISLSLSISQIFSLSSPPHFVAPFSLPVLSCLPLFLSLSPSFLFLSFSSIESLSLFPLYQISVSLSLSLSLFQFTLFLTFYRLFFLLSLISFSFCLFRLPCCLVHFQLFSFILFSSCSYFFLFFATSFLPFSLPAIFSLFFFFFRRKDYVWIERDKVSFNSLLVFSSHLTWIRLQFCWWLNFLLSIPLSALHNFFFFLSIFSQLFSFLHSSRVISCNALPSKDSVDKKKTLIKSFSVQKQTSFCICIWKACNFL